ncbi:MAG: hypothetical protein ACI90V_009004 [Bacillariaceae sp.]|jgi:hypothetical protein
MNDTTIPHGFRAVIGGCNRRRISFLLLILVVLVSSGVTGSGLRARELGIGWEPTDSSSVDVTDAPVAISDEGMVDDSDELKSAKTESSKLKSIKKKDDKATKTPKEKKGIDKLTKSEKKTKSKGDESTSNIYIIDDGAIEDSSTFGPTSLDPTAAPPTAGPISPSPPLGSSYCTSSPDETCYLSGWPACCGDDSIDCPTERPSCELTPVVDQTVAPTLAPVASSADPTMIPVVPSTQSPTSTKSPTSKKSTKAATSEKGSSFKNTRKI